MKKILFVSHGFACFMSDILFHGLKKSGYDVTEYPQGTHYYGGDSVFAGRKNLGKNDFLNFCYFDFSRKQLSDEEILNQDYDAVIITSWVPEKPWILENIYKRFKGKIPIAFVDGEDDKIIRKREFYNDIYFKREACNNENVKPITFGIIDKYEFDLIDYNKKHYDLSFIASGHNINSLRCQMFRFLKQEKNDKIFYMDVERDKRGMLSYAEYFNVLRNSKIGISIEGEGYDTYRYWEVPYFGAMLIADMPKIDISNNFIDMETFNEISHV